MTLSQAFDIIKRLLVGKHVSEKLIQETIAQFSPMLQGVNPDDLKDLLLMNYNVTIDPSQALVDKNTDKPWIVKFKESHRVWPFWDRYYKYLEVVKHFSPKVLNELDDTTDSILDKLYNPSEQTDKIKKKGLVVGQVQSGKTANYTGLICKAADAGFNFIIVLAGALNDLRSQTQGRLDEGFLGFDTQLDRAFRGNEDGRWIGAGLIEHKDSGLIANSYTTSLKNGDFKKSKATENATGFNFLSRDPMLLVIKKNKSILNNLHDWLKSNKNDLDTKNLLLIDDEADHYSINTKKDGDRTEINKGIRRLLGIFPKAAYIGYTATPFANIFIDINDKTDLFPKDFIISLPIATNYIGPERFFGVSENMDAEEDPMVIPAVSTISDYSDFIPDNHKQADDLPDDLPPSMKKAIKCFILNCAIRKVRGQDDKHNSMLIHVSRYKRWHNRITELVDGTFRFYSNMIKADDPAMLEELRKLYEEDSDGYLSYKSVTECVKGMDIGKSDPYIRFDSWDDVKKALYPSVLKIKVKAINGDSKEELNYDGGYPVSVIAIGGDKLSRGLTLEGLSVSYFLRASKLYDTLMQMGRWFGYRPGYVDLCRLFLSDEVNGWYRHIAIATKELRDEFKYLYETGRSPAEFALKVRIHPGALKITALGKMRNSEDMRVSWAGHLSETYLLKKDPSDIRRNLNVTKTLIDSLGNSYEDKDGKYLWRNVDASLIEKFIGDFVLPESLANFDNDAMVQFIGQLVKKGEYTDWSVVLNGIKSDKNGTYSGFGNGIVVNLNRRSDSKKEPKYYTIIRNHIISPEDEYTDLDITDLDKKYVDADMSYKHRYKAEHPETADADLPKLSKSKWIRNSYRSKKTPLLNIYPLTPTGTTKPDGSEFKLTDDPVIGFAISFPETESEMAVAYKVNKASLLNSFIQNDNEFDNYNDNEYEDDND